MESTERDRREARRGRRLLAPVLLALSMALVAACGDDEGPPGPAAAYATVITWLAERATSVDERPTVFVMPQGEGFAIGLQLQADIVKLLADVADVRFVDERAEALDGEGRPLDGGQLLVVGPASEDGARVHIQVDEVIEIERTRAWRFTLRPRGDEWRIAGSPSSVPG